MRNSDRRRILIVVTSSTTADAFVGPIVAAFENQGCSVEIACSIQRGEQESNERVDMHHIDLARSANPTSLVRAAWQLRKLIRDSRPDILVCATPVASLLGTVVARFCGDLRVVYLAWGLRSETMRGPARKLVRFGERITVACAQVTLANSDSLRRAVMENAPARADIRSLGKGSSHGVDLQRFPYRGPRLGLTFRIGFVGRLRYDKGVVELLEATRRMSEAGHVIELDLIGTVEDSELVELVSMTPHARLFPATDDVASAMSTFDVLCLPSWREGFPNVVLEASATGIPVVTTEATGARDSVVDGKTGFIVPVRDVQALVVRLTELCQDPELVRRMGNAGRSWVEENFQQTEVCNRLAAVVLQDSET